MDDDDETVPLPASGSTSLGSSASRPQSGAVPAIPGYEVLEPIGSGGMATVYKARHLVLERIVALKIIRPEFAADETYRSRFLREARIAAGINHPGVIRIHDAGETADTLYLVMDFVAGGDLGRYIRQPKPMAEAEVLRVICICVAGLRAVHAAGIIHRDLKPDNILIGDDGQPLLTDLGLARREGADDRLTATGMAMGTPAYMAPEQASGSGELDVRTDVYAIGATLFALLTGRPPFAGATAWATVASLLNDPAPAVRSLAPQVSEGLATLVAQCLDKDPAQRPEDTDQLLTRLCGLAGIDPATVAPPPGSSALATAVAAGAGGKGLSISLPLLVGGGLAVVILTVIVTMLAVGGDADPQVDTPAAAIAPAVVPAAPLVSKPPARADAELVIGNDSVVVAAEPAVPATSDPPTAEPAAKAKPSGWSKFVGGLRKSFRQPTMVTTDLSVADSFALCADVLDGLGAVEREEKDDKVDRVWEARLDKRDIRIRVRPHRQAGQTEIEIQCGAIHDKQVGKRVRQAIEAALLE